ncbi:MAG: DUF4272 domain-containing protein [Kurthia sp.]|nr:DUF4272 domain-containing protein [Candidatus Kurthia equi]
MTTIRLYASLEDQSSLTTKILEAMNGYIIEEEADGLVIRKKGIFKKKKICEVHQKNKRNDQDSNAFTEGYVGYLAHQLHGNEQVKKKLLHHAENINTIVSFEVEEKEIRKVEFMAKIFGATKEIGGVIFLPSGYILDASGKEVVDGQGEIVVQTIELTVVEKQTQYDVNKYAQSTVENQSVRQATIAKLQSNGIPYANQLPLLPDTKDMQLLSVEQIARRAAVVLIIIQFVREIVDDSEKASIKTSKRIAEVFLNRYGVKMNMTPSEEAFLQQTNYDKQQLIDKMWLYESAWVMLWSIGLVENLEEPQQICDVEHLLMVLASYQNIGELLTDAALRPAAEIFVRMDENYLYYWACVDARMKNLQAPADLDEGIVMERQRAFNWMSQLQNATWDDIKVNDEIVK